VSEELRLAELYQIVRLMLNALNELDALLAKIGDPTSNDGGRGS
jgi:hypothetical protein